MTAQRLCKTRQTHFSGAKRTPPRPEGTCPVCGSKYAKSREWQKFCSTKCRKAAWLKRLANTEILGDHEARLRAIEKRLGLGG